MIFSINASHFETHLISMNYQYALNIFGLKEVSDQKALTKIYKNLAKKKHPDAGGSSKAFNELVDAYKTLQKPAPSQSPKNKSAPKTKFETPQETSDFKETYEYEKLRIKQDLSWFHYLFFWFLVLVLRYKITYFNQDVFLKTNTGKYLYLANKKTNINNVYLKLNKKYIKVKKNSSRFVKINELIFILFI